jgi:polyferredoxin
MKRKKLSSLRFIAQIAYLAIFITGVLSRNYVMLFITVTAILLGPIFCGWMCFVGLFQDSCRYLGLFIKKEPIEVGEKAHSVLKYSRYLILIGSVTIGGLFLFPGKVWGNFAGLIKGHAVINAAFYFLIILGVVSLFTRRFFCRYLCTFGAKLGLFSLLRPITINRKKSCISCNLCSKECPMKIKVDKINSLANPNCINCLNCVESCPNSSLKVGLRNYLKP